MQTPDTTARLREEFDEQLRAALEAGNVQPLRDRYLGRKDGVVTRLLKDLATAPAANGASAAADANDFKRYVEQRLAEAGESVREALARAAAARNRIDVTLPGRLPPLGHRHPLTIIRDQTGRHLHAHGLRGRRRTGSRRRVALLRRAEHAGGTSRARHAGHAVSGVADAGRLADRRPRTLLRTHTSSMQIRYMQAHTPPIRIVVPGRVYRRDDLDLTHSPAFGQIEGLVVGEGISLADLKGTLLAFAHQMFSPAVRLRFRPSFFPYTEPSAEIDLSCWQCDGAGCPMCKKTGWIELGGCGMVHPAVFEAVGYDAERYTGFAWGIGIERIAILRYQVEDIRLFYENDLQVSGTVSVLAARLSAVRAHRDVSIADSFDGLIVAR